MSLFEYQVAEAIAAHGLFMPEQPVWAARAPGRLDVMGGNVDYTGGMVLQGLLREAIWVAAQARTDDVVRIFNQGVANSGWVADFELKVSDLGDPEAVRAICERREGARWGCYVLGALHFLKKFHGCADKGGIDVFIASDLPPNKGVSSSAALEVAVLKAASAAWGASFAGVELAIAGQWVENVVVGAACGIMDQGAIVLGKENHLLPMLCQPCRPMRSIALPAGLGIWGIDSLASRSTTSTVYETARAAAFMGYKLICQREGVDIFEEEDSAIPRWTDSRWQGYLSNLAPSEFRSKYERWLPEMLSGREFPDLAGAHVDPFTKIDPDSDYPVRAAVRYATEENFRVEMVRTLLETASWSGSESSLRAVGEILCQSHVAYAECGLGSAPCDELVERALRAGLPGAKMTGGGGGGVVAILGRLEDRSIVYSIAEEYGAAHGTMPHIFEGSSDGVDAFGARILQPVQVRRRQ